MNDPTDNPTPTCLECVKLRQEIEVLKAFVHELQQRLNRNSSNFSIPPFGKSARCLETPSAQSYRTQAGRSARPSRASSSAIAARKSHRSRRIHPRKMLGLLGSSPLVITEHQAHSRMCMCYGKLNRAEIPPQILSHTIGPRVAAVMSCLSGTYRLSRRSVKEILERVFNVLYSLGTIVKLEAQAAISLADSYNEILAGVRANDVKNTDGEMDVTVLVFSRDVVIANDAETVIQQTVGYADLLT